MGNYTIKALRITTHELREHASRQSYGTKLIFLNYISRPIRKAYSSERDEQEDNIFYHMASFEGEMSISNAICYIDIKHGYLCVTNLIYSED